MLVFLEITHYHTHSRTLHARRKDGLPQLIPGMLHSLSSPETFIRGESMISTIAYIFPENYTHRQFLNSSFAEKAYGLPLAIPGILYSLYIREHAIPGEKKKVCHYLTLIQIIILTVYHATIYSRSKCMSYCLFPV